jgi:hypothetical protein
VQHPAAFGQHNRSAKHRWRRDLRGLWHDRPPATVFQQHRLIPLSRNGEPMQSPSCSSICHCPGPTARAAAALVQQSTSKVGGSADQDEGWVAEGESSITRTTLEHLFEACKYC